jgi:two-component system LytT family response regulator
MNTTSAADELRVLIVDDERAGRDRLSRLVRGIDGVTVGGEYSSATDASRAIKSEAFDLVLLDVEMPDHSGLELADLVGSDMPPTVFVTAHSHYAVKAFELNAIDYLLKPVSRERLEAAIRRVSIKASEKRDEGTWRKQLEGLADALRQLSSVADSTQSPAVRYLLRFPARTDTGTRLIKVSDVDSIHAAGNYVKINVGKAQSYKLRESLDALEETLDPSMFARIHRSIIVNLDRVKELQPWFRGDYVVVMQDGTTHKLSRWYRDRVRHQLLHGTISSAGEDNAANDDDS